MNARRVIDFIDLGLLVYSAFLPAPLILELQSQGMFTIDFDSRSSASQRNGPEAEEDSGANRARGRGPRGRLPCGPSAAV